MILYFLAAVFADAGLSFEAAGQAKPVQQSIFIRTHCVWWWDRKIL